MSEKLTCSNDTLPDQSLLATAKDLHAAILRWADDHPLEAWAVVAAVRGAEPSAERLIRVQGLYRITATNLAFFCPHPRSETRRQPPRSLAYVFGPQLKGRRTILAVPMLRGDTIVDVIVVQRIQVKPFTGKQIALVQNSSHRSCASRKYKRGFTMSDVPSDLQ